MKRFLMILALFFAAQLSLGLQGCNSTDSVVDQDGDSDNQARVLPFPPDGPGPVADENEPEVERFFPARPPNKNALINGGIPSAADEYINELLPDFN